MKKMNLIVIVCAFATAGTLMPMKRSFSDFENNLLNPEYFYTEDDFNYRQGDADYPYLESSFEHPGSSNSLCLESYYENPEDSEYPYSDSKSFTDDVFQKANNIPSFEEHAIDTPYSVLADTPSALIINEIAKEVYVQSASLTCNTCSKTFTEEGNLKKHIKKFHDKKEDASITQYPLPTTIITPGIGKLIGKTTQKKAPIKPVFSPMKPYVCNICGKGLTQKSSLKTHIQTIHEKIKLYSCEQCKESFASTHKLNNHIKKAHEEIKYVCDRCGKSFNQKGNLTKHINDVHEEIRSYPCSYENCSWSFKRKSQLDDHIRAVHEKIKPYACAICNKPFAAKSDIKKHMQKKHPSEPINF